jgi:hypothetical protein
MHDPSPRTAPPGVVLLLAAQPLAAQQQGNVLLGLLQATFPRLPGYATVPVTVGARGKLLG